MKTIDVNQDLREERVNSITHACGILFGLICIPLLMMNATNRDFSVVAGTAIYGFSFLMVFTFSTLFHWQSEGRKRHILKILDHISIYFMIAGTYTPFILIFVDNSFGHTMLVVLWALTILGAIFKIFFTGKFEILSTLIYLVMGWMLLTGADEFFAKMPSSIVMLIIAGAILYSVGVIFYIWRLFAYHHAVWHVFVLAGAICHYSAVLTAV